MEIIVKESKSIPIIEIIGEVDLYNTKDLKDLFDQLIKQGKYKVVLNLKNVPFMDSEPYQFEF
jgi:anti-anti-sigma factor